MLWILIGCASLDLLLTRPLVVGIIHLLERIKDINTSSLPIYCKSCSLPKGEIPEGTEHATEAVPELDAYNESRDKYFKVNNVTSRAQLNPLELNCVHVLMLTSSGRRLVKGSINKQNQQEDSNTPNKYINYQESTTRLPKRSNPYGNGGGILGYSLRMQAITKGTQLSRSFMASAGNGAANEMKLVLIDGKYVNLYKLICSKDLLIQSYMKIRSNSGGMTPGIDNKTFDGIDDKFFDELAYELDTEKFKFTPVKRVYIPKKNGKTRPLGIPTFKDKIVQEAIRTILEVIFEGKFLDVSHGFRPKRSCHSALHQISKWNGTT